MGHIAFSSDVQECSGGHPEWHMRGDVLRYLNFGWDMIIAFPPCTHLSSSGAAFWKEKQLDGRQQEGIDFFMRIINADCEKIAVENPVGIMSTKYQKPTQYIQPWEHGHKETKKTGLWLKNLPKLTPSDIVTPVYIIGKDGKRYSPIHYMSYHKDRAKLRSKTYQGIANAMAAKWG